MSEILNALENHKRGQSFNIEGKTYQNLKEACSALNLNYSNTSKIKRKLNIDNETAILMQIHKVKDHQGRYFRTYKEMAAFHKISYSTLMKRLADGYPLERVFQTCNTGHTDLQGRTFNTWEALCKANNYSYSKLRTITTSKHSDTYVLDFLEKECKKIK